MRSLHTTFVDRIMMGHRRAPAVAAVLAVLGCCPAPEAREESVLLRRGAASVRVFVPLTRHIVPGPVWPVHTYSGNITLGLERPQQFSVVFDTASGHVVVPDERCQSPACRQRRRYQIADSPGAFPVQRDGISFPGLMRDEIEVGYDTGSFVGDFVRESVCMGGGGSHGFPRARTPRACRDVGVVVARFMSKDPFEALGFDGIFGLGLNGLSTAPMFSFIGGLAKNKGVAQFGIYLSRGDGQDGGEVTMAGYNPARLRSPLAWTPAASPELGYWQVRIRAVRIEDQVLDVCRKGDCWGIVDSGASHLGVPRPHMKELLYGLAGVAQDLTDCRLAKAPTLTLELEEGVSLTLGARDLMRQSSSRDARLSLGHAKSAERPKLCKPRLVPVSLPAPLAKNLFILGQPVLQRYYTAFEWRDKAPRVGFGLAEHGRGEEEDVVFLVQVTFGVQALPC